MKRRRKDRTKKAKDRSANCELTKVRREGVLSLRIFLGIHVIGVRGRGLGANLTTAVAALLAKTRKVVRGVLDEIWGLVDEHRDGEVEQEVREFRGDFEPGSAHRDAGRSRSCFGEKTQRRR